MSIRTSNFLSDHFRWIKINDVKNFCFVGGDAIAFNLKSHILFTNLTTKKESSYRADLENGDGVACLAGHRVFPIFAFAENCWNARIFIVSFPEFNRISILEGESLLWLLDMNLNSQTLAIRRQGGKHLPELGLLGN